MSTTRLEAFTDGVLAILITIMVLELHVPSGTDLGALRPVAPVLAVYLLSFVFLGIYWNNHHHMFHLVDRVTAGILWANLDLLFWLSLVPFVTGWMALTGFAAVPTAAYGAVLLMAAVAYWFLVIVINRAHEPDARVRLVTGSNTKGTVSAGLYLVAVPLALLFRWAAVGIYVAVAMMWFIPNRGAERTAE